MPPDPRRRCCDGLCEQGRRCPAVHASVFAPTYTVVSLPRRSWLGQLVRRAARHLRLDTTLMRGWR